MIFKTEIEDFHLLESYKERNLYYKLFGGYFLNELVPGYNERKEKFLVLLQDAANDSARFFDEGQKAKSILQTMASEKWNVTFDYHLAQIFQEDKKDDRGEMSDVLITTKTSMLSIECKFFSDFTIDKDIYSVQNRIQKFSKKFSLAPLQILLLKKSKWNNSSKIAGRLKPVLDDSQSLIPIIVIFWDEFLSIIDDDLVKDYLEKQINRKSKYTLVDP